MTAANALTEACLRMEHACICFNLRSASRAVSAHYDGRFEAVGLKATQYNVLMALTHQEKKQPTVSFLAEALVLDQSSLSRTLAVLDRDGLVRLKPGREDRRERIVGLTPKGRALVLRGLPVWQEAQKAVAKAFGTRQFQAQITGLRRLARAMKEMSPVDGEPRKARRTRSAAR